MAMFNPVQYASDSIKQVGYLDNWNPGNTMKGDSGQARYFGTNPNPTGVPWMDRGMENRNSEQMRVRAQALRARQMAQAMGLFGGTAQGIETGAATDMISQFSQQRDQAKQKERQEQQQFMQQIMMMAFML